MVNFGGGNKGIVREQQKDIRGKCSWLFITDKEPHKETLSYLIYMLLFISLSTTVTFI